MFASAQLLPRLPLNNNHYNIRQSERRFECGESVKKKMLSLLVAARVLCATLTVAKKKVSRHFVSHFRNSRSINKIEKPQMRAIIRILYVTTAFFPAAVFVFHTALGNWHAWKCIRSDWSGVIVIWLNDVCIKMSAKSTWHWASSTSRAKHQVNALRMKEMSNCADGLELCIRTHTQIALFSVQVELTPDCECWYAPRGARLCLHDILI